MKIIIFYKEKINKFNIIILQIIYYGIVQKFVPFAFHSVTHFTIN